MRVLVSGYYGLGNLGDEALLGGLVGALRRRGHQPVVLSGDPGATRTHHGVDASHRTRGLLGAVLRADALVSGGGGLLQDSTSLRSLRYYLGVVRLARLAGRPIVVYGQSLGPLSDVGRAQVASVLRGVPLFVRDAQSVALAESLGLRARLVGDPALLLPAPDSRPTSPPGLRPLLVVPRAGQDALNDALVGLAARVAATGRAVEALALHPGEDDPSVARLVAAVPGVVRVTAPTPTAAIALFAAAGFVVSVRLHGCILAALAGTGFAGLSYDPKVAGFLEQARAPSFVAPVDEVELTRVALEARALDQAATARLVALAESGVDALAAALAAGRSGGAAGG